jgi:chromosome segregation ATPase
LSKDVSTFDISSPLETIDEENSLQDLISGNGIETEANILPVSQLSINPHPMGGVSDVETLKSYVALREQDVAVLTGQLRSSQERIQQLEISLKVEKARGAELGHLVAKQEQTIKHYDREKRVELEVLEKQMDDLNQQLKERTDKARTIEAKLRLTCEEVEKVKERVRVDIRRIRVREKELENQLEIVKKDSQALIHARDEKVIELKRKIDLLEFNMELVQEQYAKERQAAEELKARIKDAATVMKQAGGMLDQ